MNKFTRKLPRLILINYFDVIRNEVEDGYGNAEVKNVSLSRMYTYSYSNLDGPEMDIE